LVHRETDNGEAKDGMEIVLRGAAGGVFGFDIMNKGTDNALRDVKPKKDDTGFLVEMSERKVLNTYWMTCLVIVKNLVTNVS
jgi:hypothetical protein